MKIKYLILLLAFFLAPITNAKDVDNAKFYGININPGVYGISADDTLKMVQKTGFNSIRQEISWGSLEKEKGIYTVVGKTVIKDEIIRKSKSYNITPILILDYSNNFYDKGNYPLSEASKKGFVNYATWIAKKYKGVVNTYEIWNEWTLGTGMKNKNYPIPSADKYYELVKETSIALKKVDPSIQVIAGSFNPTSPTGRNSNINDTQWFLQLINLGIMSYIDGVSIHPYSFLNRDRLLRTPEYNYFKLIELQKNLMNATGSKKNIPIYITEMGVSNFMANGGVSEAVSADFIIKYTALVSTLPYVRGIWWYNLINDGNDMKNKEHNFGFYNNDRSKKQVVNEFENLMKAINLGELSSCVVNIKNEKVYLLKEKNVCATWRMSKLEQYNRLLRTFDHCSECNEITFENKR